MPDPLPSATEVESGAVLVTRVVPPNGPPLDFSFQDLTDLSGPAPISLTVTLRPPAPL